jgi:hypothetical protein
MHSHQGQYILYYINHQSINPLTSINHLTSINQTIGINDNMIQHHSETYHDTWTHYLMEQDPLLLQNQTDGMDVTADSYEVLKKIWALQGQAQVIWLSVLHV